ncbi:MAG: hypothetical protein AABY22_32790 [Nanoarchaeota archaeon]
MLTIEDRRKFEELKRIEDFKELGHYLKKCDYCGRMTKQFIRTIESPKDKYGILIPCCLICKELIEEANE